MNTQITIPSDDVLKEVAEKLTANGMTTHIVTTKEEAKEKVLSLIPDGAEVMDMTSVTLSETGILHEILDSGNYTPVKKLLSELTDNDAKLKRQLGAAPDYAIGSVHAITKEGQVLIASNTGSQLPAYVYGAEHVIWVVGAQKIVEHTDEGIRRIYDHVRPLEDKRAREAYGVGTNVSKILIVNKEINSDRITVVLVKEKLGY